jgi:hypothetical protein
MTARPVDCQWYAPGAEPFDSVPRQTLVEVFTDAVVFEQHDGSRQVYELARLVEALGFRVEDARAA